jgi:RNA polymerase sigma-70 factor (ECF subfamily)
MLSRALQQLPPEQREVILLKEVRDMKLEDVARITGTNLNTVKSRLRYALLGLREHLSREGVSREDGHDM